MSDVIARYERIADRFTAVVRGVPADRWKEPAPCEGWVARDVVDHLTEWVPGFFAGHLDIDLGLPPGGDDRVAAWAALDAALRRVLAERHDEVESPIASFVAPDVLVHTWDLARATGQDETLDAEEVSRLLEAFAAMDDGVLRNSGHYGPRVPVATDADEQTRLIAFTGRRP